MPAAALEGASEQEHRIRVGGVGLDELAGGCLGLGELCGQIVGTGEEQRGLAQGGVVGLVDEELELAGCGGVAALAEESWA